MPDYLEEALDNVRALLDQVKRLEQELTGGAAEDRALPELPPASGGKPVRGEELPAGESAREHEEELLVNRKYNSVYYWEERNRQDGEDFEKALPAPGRADGEPEIHRQIWTPPEIEVPRRVRTPLEMEERDLSPLLAQLERLDRAASQAPAGAGGDRSSTPVPWPGAFALSKLGADGPDAAGGAEGFQSMGQGQAGPVVQGAEELRWAEQADRVFRRDSRRYDGGFYLY